MTKKKITFVILSFCLRNGSKKIQKIMKNSIIGGGGRGVGSARVIFHVHFFLVPNGLKINFRH